jgi:hypothetical protein
MIKKIYICDICNKETTDLYRVFVEDMSIENQKNGGFCHTLELCSKCIKEKLDIEVTENE